MQTFKRSPTACILSHWSVHIQWSCAFQKASGLQHMLRKLSMCAANPVILVCIKPYCTFAERWNNICTASLLLPRSTELNTQNNYKYTYFVLLYRKWRELYTDFCWKGKPYIRHKSHHIQQDSSLCLTWSPTIQPAKQFKAIGHHQKFYKLIIDLSMVLRRHVFQAKNGTKD